VLTTLFKNGGSQAMRIPAAFRFEGDTVDVEWDETLKALIVRPSQSERMNSFFSWVEAQPEFKLPEVLPLNSDGRLDVAAFMDMGEEAA
jgi:virulence-associated protein VagC